MCVCGCGCGCGCVGVGVCVCLCVGGCVRDFILKFLLYFLAAVVHIVIVNSANYVRKTPIWKAAIQHPLTRVS